jgi:hypothetical protein
MASSRRLVALDRCQAKIRRSNSRICAFNIRSCVPRAARHARATSGRRWSLAIRGNSKQLLDILASHRGYGPELGHVGADGTDHRGLLADEELARAMQHQAALLLRRLGLDKPHVGPGHRLTDGLGVSGIVLLPLDIGLHIGRRHQAHIMPERLELARPMMRGGAGLPTRHGGSFWKNARR